MKSPDLGLIQKSRDFVTTLLVENKKINSKYTQSYFAKRLRWPNSYLSDIVHDRKPLTITRAVQLATFLRLDDLELEKLLLIVIGERVGIDKISAAPKIPTSMYKSPRLKKLGNIHDNLEAMAVLTEISTTTKRPSPKDICEKLYTFPELTELKVKAYIDEFIARDFLVIGENGHMTKPISASELLHDRPLVTPQDHNQMRNLHAGYAENFIRYLEILQYPRVINSGFLPLDVQDYLEVQTRIFRLRNWLINRSLTSEQEPRKNGLTLAFQYDLNFFPISKHDLNLDEVRKLIRSRSE